MVAASGPSTQSPQLLYVYGPDCGACIKFMAEAGAIYPKTREAARLPMVRVTLDDWQAGRHPLAQCAIGPVMGTPTFVQVVDCREMDRITGYSSDELWWLSLKRLMDRLPPDDTPNQVTR
jgi:hypothetical protein